MIQFQDKWNITIKINEQCKIDDAYISIFKVFITWKTST